ncbi:SDR family oxidoreductase [Aquibium carbonis]|uniref:SDR family oxidoreductase n=1 Tax=Aquibium carbonis TaxID=2495581 RepID=A0A3R9YA65_9HYPH|nr:SDR family NAD(P)-dependent oxidoreductase [Aquibium carbonis]RST87704.1 SDR family oxidoreductase [Aquibium carbonis]
MGEFDDRHFVITGGAGAIGKACAHDLLLRGAQVTLVDVDDDRLVQAKSELGHDDRVISVVSRIENASEADAALGAAGRPVHGLVNMAGLLEHDPLDPDDTSVWDRSLAANLTNAYHLAVAYQRHRDADVVGRIVMCSSLAFRRGTPGHVPYSSAKAGIVGMVRALSREFAPHTLVNAVAPGLIHTPMSATIVEARGEQYLATIPLKRFGRPEDVAGVVTFLCGEASAYMTGQTINVDAGMWNS